jgi:hypothetical protein
MALHWSSEECDSPRPIGKREGLERDRIIFATQAVGLSTVTAENLLEWVWRLWVWNELGRGQLLGNRPATVLRRWIGLWTNVEDETRDKWKSRLLTAAFERADVHAERACGLRSLPKTRGSKVLS